MLRSPLEPAQEYGCEVSVFTWTTNAWFSRGVDDPKNSVRVTIARFKSNMVGSVGTNVSVGYGLYNVLT
jgi:hypothetical protein